MTEKILFGIPSKGRLKEDTIKMLRDAGFEIKEQKRKYLAESNSSWLKFIFLRAADIPVFVKYGALDMGITGHDFVVERGNDITELLDLKYGRADLCLGVSETSNYKSIEDLPNNIRVGTEFPRITTSYFDTLGINAEVIELRGSVEITIALKLTDAIVDLVSTGKTFRENGLVVIDKIMETTARLIVNPITFRTKEPFIEEIRENIAEVIK